LPDEISELGVESQCPVIAVNGFGMVAEVVMGTAETLPRRGGQQVTVVVVEGEGALAVVQGCLVVVEHGVEPTDGIQRGGGAPAVTGLLERGECLPLLVQGLVEVATRLRVLGAVVVRPPAAGGVAG